MITLFILQPFAYAQEKAARPNVSSQTSSAACKTRGMDDGSYTIGPGDILAIHIWKEPEISQEEVLVRIDGKISFPLIGDIKVAGLTPVQVRSVVQKKLKDYIETPTVAVIVKSQGSQQFYILGEIAHTGAYPLYKNLTILQAFALAGGFSEWAAKKEIILLRNEGGEEKIIIINYKDIIKGKDFGQNVVLKADDTIIVP